MCNSNTSTLKDLTKKSLDASPKMPEQSAAVQ